MNKQLIRQVYVNIKQADIHCTQLHNTHTHILVHPHHPQRHQECKFNHPLKTLGRSIIYYNEHVPDLEDSNKIWQNHAGSEIH